MSVEPLLRKSNRRFVLFPIQYQKVWEMYNHQLQSFWTAEEIDFSADISDWESLLPQEREFLENILAFFAGSDGIIFENINCNFSEEIQIPEVRCCYGFQAMMENIHSTCYSLMIETYVKDEKRKDELLNAIEKLPAVQEKAQWACKYLDQSIPFGVRLIAFAIVEGIFFAGSFCSIFWLKYTKGKMTKAFGKSNEFIARDESLHVDFSVLLYSYIEDRISEYKIHSIFKEAVDVEKRFINDSLKCNLLGMNAEKMSQYIEFVSDRLLNQLGYNKLYNVTCPFSFMETMGLDGKTNFFENRISEYNRPEQLNGSGLSSTDILDDF